MELQNVLQQRRSIRKYKQQPVEKEKIEEMISEAKEEGTYEEMKEEIEADIKRAKYLQTISIRKTK